MAPNISIAAMNEISDHIWPKSANRNNDGALVISGLDVIEISQIYARFYLDARVLSIAGQFAEYDTCTKPLHNEHARAHPVPKHKIVASEYPW